MRVIRVLFLKPKTQTNTPVSVKRAKTVFVIIVVKQIFNRAEHAQIESFAFERNVVATGQVGATVAVETINAGRKANRREVTACSEKIEINPSAPESLRRNERKLMFRYA